MIDINESIITVDLPLSDAALLYLLLRNSSTSSYDDLGFTKEEASQLDKPYHRINEQLKLLAQ